MDNEFNFDYVNPSLINVNDKKQLNKLYNCIEDLCYVYETNKNKLTLEEKEQIERYIIDISRWTNLNKEKIKNYKHKYIDIFRSIQADLKGIDDLVAKLITPVHNNTLYNWLSYFKSSDAFYAIKGNHKKSSELPQDIDKMLNSAIINANKSVRTEKFAGYLIYIVSGQASQDYIENGTGEYYKACAELATNKKDLDVIAPSGRYDGEVDNNDEKLILFATSNENTEKQDVFKALRNEPGANLIFVFAPTFNQKYSYVHTEFNGRKAEQHGTSFLKQFDEDFSYNELGDFNMLPFMALINNVKVPTNEGIKITDFLRINPFAFGTDTYPYYKALRDINEFYEPEKTERLQQFFLDYLEKITDKLSYINDDFNLTSDTEDILLNTQKVIRGVLKNFNKSNLENEIPDEKSLEKLKNIICKYNSVALRADRKTKESKVSTDIIDEMLMGIQSKDDVIYHLKKSNIEVENYKKPIVNKIVGLTQNNEEKYIELFHNDFHIPLAKANSLVKFIKTRQVNSVQNTFSNLDSGDNVFYFQHRDKEVYRTIFNFIENKFDFNNPAVRESLSEQLSLCKSVDEVEVIKNLSLEEKIKKVFSLITDGSSYKLNAALMNFIDTIDQAGEDGLKVYSIYRSSFYKNQIEYKECTRSYWRNMDNSPKTAAHKTLMEILDLYSFSLYKKPVFTAKMLNDNLDDYLSKKAKPKVI